MLEVIWQSLLKEGKKGEFEYFYSHFNVVNHSNHSNHSFNNTVDQIKNWNLSFPSSHSTLPIPLIPVFS